MLPPIAEHPSVHAPKPTDPHVHYLLRLLSCPQICLLKSVAMFGTVKSAELSAVRTETLQYRHKLKVLNDAVCLRNFIYKVKKRSEAHCVERIERNPTVQL